MMNIIEEEDVITNIMIIITIIVIIITEVDFTTMMMTTTQAQVHLQAALRQAVPVAVIKHRQVEVPAVRLPVLHRAVPHLEAIRRLQAEEAVAVLRQEVQVRIIDQAEENQGIKMLI